MKVSTAIVVLAAAASACSSSSAPKPEPGSPVAITTTTAVMRRVPRTFEAGGVIRALTTATLASRITAPVLTIAVSAGDRVRAGQTLVTLDARELDANRSRAAAQLTALERSKDAALADRAAADAALTLARASHARIAALHARESATPQELDEAVSALRVAEARLGAADAQAAAATASLEAAHQAEAAASVAASYAILTAPFNGVITERVIDPGTLATPGAPLLRIEDTSRFRLEVIVDESNVARINERAAVDVLLDREEGEETPGASSLKGTVSEIARAVDAGSHSFLVKLALPPHTALRSGMFGRARFTSGAEDLLTISPQAIVPQGQLSTIYVVSSDNRARMRVIDAGGRGTDWVEVLAGVSAGERVILSPIGIRDGTPVRTADAEVLR